MELAIGLRFVLALAWPRPWQAAVIDAQDYLARLLARRPDGIFVNPFERGEIGPDLFRAA